MSWGRLLQGVFCFYKLFNLWINRHLLIERHTCILFFECVRLIAPLSCDISFSVLYSDMCHLCECAGNDETEKKKRLGTMVCEFLRSVRLVSSFSSLLHCWKPFYQSWVQCVLLITPRSNAFVLFFFSFPVLFRMSYVFTRYSSISFFVVGIAPNKETFVSVTNALFWMIWLLVWHLCCSNALLVCRWFTFPTS